MAKSASPRHGLGAQLKFHSLSYKPCRLCQLIIASLGNSRKYLSRLLFGTSAQGAL